MRGCLGLSGLRPAASRGAATVHRARAPAGAARRPGAPTDRASDAASTRSHSADADHAAAASADGAATWRIRSVQLPPQEAATESAPRPPGLPETVPPAPPPTREQVTALADFIAASRRLLVLTGAGVSTESAIPDYRSPGGAYSSGYLPMTHQQFMRAHANRRRYWARSFVGWERFAERTRPNAAHDAIARLQRADRVWALLTQNVDRLHQAAGAERVIEMHGTTHEVICMSCGARSCRFAMQKQLAALNPAWAPRAGRAVSRMEQARPSVGPAAAWPAVSAPIADDGASELASEPRSRPDGDVDVAADAYEGFMHPDCDACGGILKPDVVYFGDNLPPERAEATRAAAAGADAMLVVGSSLQVYSAFRLAKAVAEAGKPLAIVNIGPTRADGELPIALRLQAIAGEILPRALAEGGLDLPPLGG